MLLRPVVLVSMLLTLPMAPAFAETRVGDTIVISQAVADDFYAVGGRLQIDASVAGDAVLAGGSVDIEGDVDGDVSATGGQIAISGGVGDDDDVVRGEHVVEEPVARAAHQLHVEVEIGALQGVRVAGGRGGVEVGEAPVEGREVAGGGRGGRVAGAERLQPAADVVDVHQLLPGVAAHERPPAGHGPHQALLLQAGERRQQGRAGHTEPGRKLLLRELLARGEIPVDDHGLEGLVGFLIQVFVVGPQIDRGPPGRSRTAVHRGRSHARGGWHESFSNFAYCILYAKLPTVS